MFFNICFPFLKKLSPFVTFLIILTFLTIKFRKVMGIHQRGRSGLGLSKATVAPPKGTHGYRKYIADLSSAIDCENDLARAAQLHLQRKLD